MHASRSKLEGLLILRWFPETKILQHMSGELREELERLERLDNQTESLYSTTHRLCTLSSRKAVQR